jgi:glycosyltransferase involved in cell wall biosynthesis
MKNPPTENDPSENGVWALIPAYNEAERIGATIGALRRCHEITGIMVVDDGSADGTADAARAAGATEVVSQPNRGKGAALTAAYARTRDRADVFLLLDADLGDSAAEAAKLLGPVLADEADMTIGTLPPDPDFAASGKRGGMGFVVRLARWGIRRTTGRTFRQPLSGQRAVRRSVLDSFGGTFGAGFGVEVALTIAALRAGHRVAEVETEFRHHVTGTNWAGIRHRGRQFRDVARIVLSNGFAGK